MEDESEILQIATTYYTKLLFIGVTKSVHTSKKCVWDKIKPNITNEMKVVFLKPFEIMEIHNALRALSLMSCQGEDGITTMFYSYIGNILGKT